LKSNVKLNFWLENRTIVSQKGVFVIEFYGENISEIIALAPGNQECLPAWTSRRRRNGSSPGVDLTNKLRP
jgi:hypothetical protein